MIEFILNDQNIQTNLSKGTTVLDFVRYHKNLKGTKIGCREGDCGACTILVGEPANGKIKYRTQTSCLMPIANANGKHIVTIEGINREDGELTQVQHALIENSGTQCGFCTVGFVMSLTNFCLQNAPKTQESAVAAIDGNICRCTGYKSIERACSSIVGSQQSTIGNQDRIQTAIEKEIVPEYFSEIAERLKNFKSESLKSTISKPNFIAGGTDLYVQKPEEMAEIETENLFDNSDLRFIRETDEFVEIGASTVVTDLLESTIFQKIFPNLYKHLKLVSSTPIRNMATIAGNFVNASPIGDMTAWFLALDTEIELSAPVNTVGLSANPTIMGLQNFYRGYKQLSKSDYEFITKIRFRKDFTHFNFEKVCKRQYLDIASVNTAISLKVTDNFIEHAHVSAGGVAPIPLYLLKTSEVLSDKEISEKLIEEACEILQTEISPISDVRGSEKYKRLLLRQLFIAHFVELFKISL